GRELCPDRTRRPRAVPDPRRPGRRRDHRVPCAGVRRRARRNQDRPRRGDAMNHIFDRQQVRRAFSRAAGSYSAAADLQREVESRLLESLEYLGEQAPADIVDLGSGPGTAAVALRQRWPKARVVAIDLALPMLRQVAPKRGWNPLQRPIDRICADARALPLADDSVDLIFS